MPSPNSGNIENSLVFNRKTTRSASQKTESCKSNRKQGRQLPPSQTAAQSPTLTQPSAGVAALSKASYAASHQHASPRTPESATHMSVGPAHLERPAVPEDDLALAGDRERAVRRALVRVREREHERAVVRAALRAEVREVGVRVRLLGNVGVQLRAGDEERRAAAGRDGGDLVDAADVHGLYGMWGEYAERKSKSGEGRTPMVWPQSLITLRAVEAWK